MVLKLSAFGLERWWMVDGGASLAGHPTRSTLRSVWKKPLAVRLPMRAMNVAPTQVRGDFASICYETYAQRLGSATRSSFAGSAVSHDLHWQRSVKELLGPNFDPRHIVVWRHTACLQIRPNSIERRSRHNQCCRCRMPPIGALKPASKELPRRSPRP